VRKDPRANALFLEVLTNVNDPDVVLRWMNEAGVFGRFIPDFGRVVAQMQFDMYHHYTVDEHSIRAIGPARGDRARRACRRSPAVDGALFDQIASRRVLYVAVLLHDIAKGRGGDHSVLGEEIAFQLCPRLGLDEAETETVAWLVRHHLLLSSTAFKRDLADPKTIEDFVRQVQSPERLRLLLILTVVDIRAVGPGVWNDWKRQLLRTLFDAAEEKLRLGHKQRGRSEIVAQRQDELAEALGWKPQDRPGLCAPASRQLLARRTARGAAVQCPPGGGCRGEDRRPRPSIVAEHEPDRGATRVSVFTPDREGLFFRICAGLASAGASIIDARVHTTRDGMALDNLLVQDAQERPYKDKRLRNRLVRSVEAALKSEEPPEIPAGRRGGAHVAAFHVAPSVAIAERRRAGRRSSRSMPSIGPGFWPGLPERSTAAGTRFIPPISPPTASGRSTSSTSATLAARSFRRRRSRSCAQRCSPPPARRRELVPLVRRRRRLGGERLVEQLGRAFPSMIAARRAVAAREREHHRREECERDQVGQRHRRVGDVAQRQTSSSSWNEPTQIITHQSRRQMMCSTRSPPASRPGTGRRGR
jgi:hypothetical protein